MSTQDEPLDAPLVGDELERRAEALRHRLVVAKDAISEATRREPDEVLIRTMQLITESSSSGNRNEESRATREALRCELDARHAAEIRRLHGRLQQDLKDFLAGLAGANSRLTTRLSLYSVVLAVLAIAIAYAAWRMG